MKRIVLLFDDLAKERNALAKGLRALLGATGEVQTFEGDVRPNGNESYDRYIAGWIEKTVGRANAALVVCDKELGAYSELRGLSATPVSAVATDLGIPFSQYSRQSGSGKRDLDRFRQLHRWSMDEVTLEGTDPEGWARESAILFKGFESIRKRWKTTKLSLSPAAMLAHVMGRPEAESRIALYGSGTQGFLREVFSACDSDGKVKKADVALRAPRILGNWLLLSILRFPGILVNRIAAASHLNIAVDDFARPAVQALFAGAEYDGPFCELQQWWWRNDLDDLLAKAGAGDGLDYVKVKKPRLSVSPCNDPETGTRAGFFCMLTQQPVSDKNSHGDIAWFPSGADLARISKAKYRQVTSLVGLS